MRSLSLTLALALASVALQADVRAQDAVQITVEEAVERGLEHNRHLRASRADVDAAEAAYRQIRAGRLPAVRASGSYQRIIGDIPEAEFTFPGLDTTFTLLPIPLNQVHTEVSVEQPLFAGFRLQNRIRAARFHADAAALMTAQEESDVAFGIRSAYWRLHQMMAARGAIDAALAAMEEHVRTMTLLVEEGAALRGELLSAQARRSEVRLERIEAENAVQVARVDFNRMIGLPLGTPTVPVSVERAVLPGDLDALLTAAIDSRPQLAAIEAQVDALEAEVAVTRGEWLPEVAATGRLIYARPNPIFFLEQDEFRGHLELGLRARWTLFEGGARSAATAQAQARLEAAQARLLDARELVEVEIMRRYLEVQRTLEALQVAAEHVREAEEAFRVVQFQFAEGAALSSEVLEAERALRAAQARLTRATGNHAVAHAALLNAVGEVW